MTVLVLMALLAGPAIADEGEPPEVVLPDWTLSVDSDHPFLGDVVIIWVDSLYVGEYATLEVFHKGMRIQQMVVRTNITREDLLIWETRLDMDAGTYRVSLIHYGLPRANVTVTLVYDPVDFALKTNILQDKQMWELMEDDQLAREWAKLALRQNDYFKRWMMTSVAINLLAMFIILYLLPDAWTKFLRGRIKAGELNWRRWLFRPDGDQQHTMGKESMFKMPRPRTPEAGLSALCETCDRLIHRTEWGSHPHELVYAAEDGFEFVEVEVEAIDNTMVIREVEVVE